MIEVLARGADANMGEAMDYSRIDITAANGVPFRIIHIPAGMRSPNRAQRDGYGAIIEFYDARYMGERFSPDGQFVSSYSSDTIADVASGLCLDMGVPDWQIDAEAMRVVAAWLALTER